MNAHFVANVLCTEPAVVSLEIVLAGEVRRRGVVVAVTYGMYKGIEYTRSILEQTLNILEYTRADGVY